ncbi:c-di-GMP-binding flagellar brake protein YcgR, contains PilZNR and PilZ domains [Clostridium sp. USBA 49]|jgi:c-di-GMP-binding flagellar brake protein YcgR|uniref:flagellar brake protein n=1 Tax=Clostridium TaxID=1485 RepID=UPI000998E920|nr:MULTISPECIES: flagellar brake domain-containing protein [Clostridium]SKA72646.1 c-di-GMP-binding flagellar brake protein YcgR, contains PilZNR and PilZ domains [Clostridium sp. USBA 49]
MGYDLKFQINNKIEIVYDDNYYKSNIEDVQDKFISINIPRKGENYIPFRKGDKLECIYYYENNIYKFYTYVIDRKIDNIPIILINYPSEIFRIQRRKFVRVPVLYSILYSKLNKRNNEAKLIKNLTKDDESFKATMIDLSGGGMKLKVKEDIKIGDIIIAYIPIKGEEIKVEGEIVRVEKDGKSRLNICGVNFINLENRLREKIIKFIFEIMREQIKKS